MRHEYNLPWGDHYMLLSFINTKLRDEYSSLQLFCDDYSVDKEKLILTLEDIGYYYDSLNNQFRTQ